MSSVVFGCSNGYFSEMKEFLFERSYCSWRVVDFDVLKDGVLAVREPGSTVEILRVDLHALHKPLAQGCHLSEVPNAIGLEFISKIVPVTSGALDSEAERPHQYRFVLTSRDAVGLLKALKAVLPVLDVSAFPLGITASAPDAVLTLEMQKLAARALNKYSRIMRAVVVRSQRGSFRWLPVACSSDLVLGSWWFVVGSIFSVAITLIVFLNDFELQTEGNAKFQIGNDDSILPQTGYRIAWALCLASSVFFTVGSLGESCVSITFFPCLFSLLILSPRQRLSARATCPRSPRSPCASASPTTSSSACGSSSWPSSQSCPTASSTWSCPVHTCI